MAFEYKDLQIENRGAVWTLKVNRPTALNALNSNVLNEMGDFLRQIGEMSFEHAKALIITGTGEKSFVAGADIKEISELNDEQAFHFSQRGQMLFHELSLLQIPVVAEVNGFALGGGLELALACDFIFASANAKFGLPEVSLGLIPGFGGTVRLLQAVGLRRARQMTYTGDMMDASEALRLGLVNHVTSGENLMSEVHGVVDKMLLKAPAGISYAKKSINFAWDNAVELAQKEEAKLFSELFQTQDVHEGTKAFLEKRKPQFQGQ